MQPPRVGADGSTGFGLSLARSRCLPGAPASHVDTDAGLFEVKASPRRPGTGVANSAASCRAAALSEGRLLPAGILALGMGPKIPPFSPRATSVAGSNHVARAGCALPIPPQCVLPSAGDGNPEPSREQFRKWVAGWGRRRRGAGRVETVRLSSRAVPHAAGQNPHGFAGDNCFFVWLSASSSLG